MLIIKHFTRSLVPTFALLLSLTACGGAADKPDKKAGKTDKAAKVDGNETKPPDAPEADMPTLDPKVEKAVSLANQLAAEPGQADAILEAAGLDRVSFQAMLYEIAGDPELSKSYAIAREA